MTPTELTAFLDRCVYGAMQARGTTADGIVWEVRTHPLYAYRITVAVPWEQCPANIMDHYASENGTRTHAILGLFAEMPDPAPALAFVARWRIVR